MTRTAHTRDFADVRGPLSTPGGFAAVFQAVEDAATAHTLATRTDDATTGAASRPVLLYLSGPPGTGKTMIASRVPTVLPALDDHARAWLTAEYEGIGVPVAVKERPFRAPHHTISATALIGAPTPQSKEPACPQCAQVAKRGGTPDPYHLFHSIPRAVVPRAGELQLARFGVLFLDELPEFSIAALEALGRAWRAMPARCRPMIVASGCPCPCGWYGVNGARECTCPASAVTRYQERIDKAIGALGAGANRFMPGTDVIASYIRADVAPVSLATFKDAAPIATSAEIAARVAARVAALVGGAS